MEQRRQFVLPAKSGEFTVTEPCERFGISRKTAYKWSSRHGERGPEGLAEGRRHFGIDEAALLPGSRGDSSKAAVAWAIRRRATQSQAWIAERLNLRSRANVSQAVRRFETREERDLSDRVKDWKMRKVVD